jgi:hypothetical protein
MLIWDRTNKPGSILLFTKEGRFITKISRAGKGPYEYNYLFGLNLCEEKERIYLIDGVKNTLIVFNLKGEPIKEVGFKNFLLGGKILDMGETLILTYQEIVENKIEEGILITDEQYVIKNKLRINVRENNSNNSGHYMMNRIMGYNNMLLYSSFPYQTVYNIDLKSLRFTKYCEFSFSGYTNEQLDQGTRELRMRVTDFKMIQNYIYIESIVDSYGQYYLYNRDNKKLYFLPYFGDLEDDVFFMKDFHLSFISMNEAVDFVQPIDIIGQENKQTPKFVKDIISDLKEQSNPILRIVKLKEMN